MSTAKEREAQKVYAGELKGISDEYIDCRDFRHSWKRQQDFRPREAAEPGRRSRLSPILYRILVCTRCGTEREDQIYARTFERLSSTYRYAEGYTMKGIGITGAKPVTILRAEQWRRAQARMSDLDARRVNGA